jgi:pimeloyl-ACP methyl ester carboxylesterase
MSGLRIELGASDADDVLVWFPAVGDSVRSFGRTALLLASRVRGLRIVGIDPPGYGGGAPPSFAELYAWAPSEVARLNSFRHIVVSGNSSGGALAAAAAAGSRTTGVIFVCWPDWRFGSPPTLEELCPLDAAGLDSLLTRSWHAMSIDDSVRERWLRQLGSPEHRAHVASFDANGYAALLDGLEVPTAFVAGESDRLVPPAVVRASAEARNAAFLILPRVGHYPQLEDPPSLASALAELWLGLTRERRS